MAKKAKKKTLGQIKAEVQKVVNRYIRLRDEGMPCISCGQHKKLQAGHYFAVSTHDGLRFDEDNIFGECGACNLFNQSHLIAYRDNLLERIGQERFDALYQRASNYKQFGYKFTRYELEEIRRKYLDKINGLV
jgi:hypothetical protein